MQADLGGVFPRHTVNGVGVHTPFRIERLAVAAQRPEQRPVMLCSVAGAFKIGPDALRGLRIDGQGFPLAALAGDAQRIKAAVLMQVADIERRDLRAAESDLQADRENGAVAQAGERVVRCGPVLSKRRRCCLRRD
jgi:hypothetical protein